MGHKEDLVKERLDREAEEDNRRFLLRLQQEEAEEREMKQTIAAITAEVDRINGLLTSKDWATRGTMRDFRVTIPTPEQSLFKRILRKTVPNPTESQEYALLCVFTGSVDGFVRSDGELYSQDEYYFGPMHDGLSERNIAQLKALLVSLTEVRASSELPVQVVRVKQE